MAKATITNVTVDHKINTAYVTYSTGTEKLYPVDKLPKTVQTWLDKNQKDQDPGVKEVRTTCPAAMHPAPEPKAEPGQESKTATALIIVETQKPVLVTTPDAQPVRTTVSPLAALQLSILFLAGTAVYTVWWAVQAIVLIIDVSNALIRHAQKAVNAVVSAWLILYPVAKEKAVHGAEIAKETVSAAWDFRAVMIAENGGARYI